MMDVKCIIENNLIKRMVVVSSDTAVIDVVNEHPEVFYAPYDIKIHGYINGFPISKCNLKSPISKFVTDGVCRMTVTGKFCDGA